jgi:transcriptional regulator with XRE-family HTH domain
MNKKSAYDHRKVVHTLGSKLRLKRIEIGFSQEELGVAIGIDESCSRTRISRYEGDLHEPAIKTVRLLALALNTPTSYFYCEERLLSELILIIDKMSDLDKLRLIKFLKNRNSPNHFGEN